MFTNPPSAKEKTKALDLALQTIEKQFGKGAIMKLGEGVAPAGIEVISTGSIGLDMALGWGQISAAILKRPYILIGFLAFLAMVPLALTSTNAAVRRMGPQAWSRLHKLVYAIGLAGAVHYLLLVKVISTKPLLYFAAVVVLLAWRAIRSRQRRLQLA